MNVLLVTTDQQRADTLGVYGSRLEATPRLDRFAASGARFDLCRTQNPYCQPSRATILTGRYPSSHGVHSNGVDFPEAEVGTTLPAMLAAAGWTIAFRGKAHFASTYPRTPTGAVESVEGSAAVPADWRGPYMGFEDVDLVVFGHHIHPGSGAMPEHWGPPPRGLHYARFLFRDGHEAGMRRLRRMEKESALRPSPAPETWASTDHGELLGDHQMLFKGPLHYDGLLRLPLLVRGPGVRARVVDAPVGTIDLVPTILDLAGLPIPATVEGRTLRPFLAGGDERRDWVLTENDHEMGVAMYLRTLTTVRWVALLCVVPRDDADRRPAGRRVRGAAEGRQAERRHGDGRLTETLVARGCTVVGVDGSAAQVAAARARGLDARVMDGQALEFAGEFDAVFTNAALHWMRRPDDVIAGVARALRPGGRFVGEMGGRGNTAAILAAVDTALGRRGVDWRAVSPWYFPSDAEYRALLEAHGFRVRRIALVPRPTPLPGDVADWLETFAETFLTAVPTAGRADLVAELRELLARRLRAADGRWSVDYVRLRFAADAPAS